MNRQALLADAKTPQAAGSARRKLDGIEDYLFIRGDRLTAAQAAARLGVSRKTIERWRAFIKQHAVTP